MELFSAKQVFPFQVHTYHQCGHYLACFYCTLFHFSFIDGWTNLSRYVRLVFHHIASNNILTITCFSFTFPLLRAITLDHEKEYFESKMFCLFVYVVNRLANKKVYVFLYGVIGCVFSATYAYFNGTITTLEKRYHISSQRSGTISVGNDISQLMASAVLSYYAGKGHRPRWMAFGEYKYENNAANWCHSIGHYLPVSLDLSSFIWIRVASPTGLGTIVIFCLMNMVPHFLYGPGKDALALTVEYGAHFDDYNSTKIFDIEKRKTLCNVNGNYFWVEIGFESTAYQWLTVVIEMSDFDVYMCFIHANAHAHFYHTTR